jgi:hypothetical protein
MGLTWFDTTEAERCALAIAELVIKGYPASERKKSHKAVSHRAKVLDQVFGEVRQFQQTQRPNFYKKAKLGNVFRWKLAENGFDAEFIKDLTHQVLVQMK